MSTGAARQTIEDHSPLTGADRRVHTRYDTRSPATLFFDPGNHTVACTVRNISSGGARIVLPEAVELPDAVQIFARPDIYRRALVRWRIGLEAGLEFIG